MTAHLQYAQIIDRPVDLVFHFIADDNVRNHPRWDPDIELWLDGESRIQVGTVIRRRNRRSGTPVEGTMQVVEYEPFRAYGTLIHRSTRPEHTPYNMLASIPLPAWTVATPA